MEKDKAKQATKKVNNLIFMFAILVSHSIILNYLLSNNIKQVSKLKVFNFEQKERNSKGIFPVINLGLKVDSLKPHHYFGLKAFYNKK